MVALVFEKDLIKEINKYYRTLWAIGHAVSLMSWDTETYMPKEGAMERGMAYGELHVLAQKILLDEKFVSMVDKVAEIEDLNDYERGVVRVLKRAIRIAKALPPRLVKELARLSQEASVVWREAKAKDNYNMFKPYLEKIIKLTREKAEYLGYEEHPYDALIDLYEEGMRTRVLNRIFNILEPGIRRVLEKVLDEGYYPKKHPLEKKEYSKEALYEVNKKILKILGYPLGSRTRLDESAHPFTIGIGLRDVRITTRYEGYDFKRSLLGAIHEFGHALYELQIDEKLMATPIGTTVSLGIHESQSRFWENIIGRSRYFVEAIYPLLAEKLAFLKEYKPEDIYLYFNIVRPSLIRTEADEVTYNLHIILRYKLEKLMITGEIGVDDLPELWNDEMERLLGIRPKKYSEGILQDIHWSEAMIGYFPTYTLGNIISAQIRHHILNDLPEFYNKIHSLEFKEIREYLREKIHKWGSTYEPRELLRKSFGEEIEPSYFLKYLEEKYLSKKI